MVRIEIENIIDDINANLRSQGLHEYAFEYDEAAMINILADKFVNSQDMDKDPREGYFVYLEEFKTGRYDFTGYVPRKLTRVELYFCRLTEFAADARERDSQRTQIETEIVLPFIDAVRASNRLITGKSLDFGTPPPRFDANEVSIALYFEAAEKLCRVREDSPF